MSRMDLFDIEEFAFSAPDVAGITGGVLPTAMDQFGSEQVDFSAHDAPSISDGVLSMEQFSIKQIDHFLSTSGNWTQEDWNLLSTAVPDGLSPYMLDLMSSNDDDFIEEVAKLATEPSAVLGSISEPVSVDHAQPSPQQSLIPSNDRSKDVPVRRRYNAKKWEEKRDLIRTLYIDQEKSLKAVRLILQEDHDFDASEKAYKDKIRDWGLNKNLKQRQAVYMLKMAKKRKEEEGKSTTFYYRGNQVSNSKIRRFSKAVDTSSDIVSVPSNITFMTPNNSIVSQLMPQGIRRSHQNESEMGCSLKKPELELLLPATQLPATQLPATQLPATHVTFHAVIEQCLGHFAPHFRVLMDRLEDMSHEQFGPLIGFTEDQKDAAMDCVSNVFQDFTKACLDMAGTDLFNELFSNQFALVVILKEIARCIDWRGGVWHCKNRAYLPVLHFRAQCAIASGSYTQAEIVIDRALTEHEHFYRARRHIYLRRATLSILLLGKAYLAQKKFFMLERLLRVCLSDMNCIQGMDKEILTLHKLLFLVRTVVLSADDNACPLDNQEYQSMAVSLVSRLLDNRLENDNREVEISWAMALMEFLRSHYGRCDHEGWELVFLLEQMQPVVKEAITSGRITQKGLRQCLIDHAVDGLLESYASLHMESEEREWQRMSRAWELSELERPCDWTNRSETEYKSMGYGMHLMGPLFTELLGEWPSIALPIVPMGDDLVLGVWLGLY